MLPQLKESSLARDAHSGMYYEAQIDQLEEAAAVKRAKRRNDRREQRALERMAQAMDGAFTKTRHRKAA